MYNDPHDTQAQHDAEVAAYAVMDTETHPGPALSPLRDMDAAYRIADLMDGAAKTTSVAEWDARIIREARELAALDTHQKRTAWLTANNRPEAAGAGYTTVNAMIMGTMQATLQSLAAGYEREINRNA
jgi:hypothetical protein